MLRSRAIVAAVPASAFWWQWPWKTMAGGRAFLRQHEPAVGDGLHEQFLRQPGGCRHRLRSRVARQQGQVLIAEGQQA